MASLQGKLIALTGAASGIGLATTHLLARHGAHLSLADISSSALSSLATSLTRIYPNIQILHTPVDIRDRDQVNSWVSRTTTHFGRPLDGVANLAGIIGRSIGRDEGTIRNVSEEEFENVMAVNATGMWNCLRAELPAMKVGEGGRGGGSIVNAASIAGLVGVVANAPYVASKHVVVGLTKTAAKEEGKRAIRVNAIAPGIVETPMMEEIERTMGTTKLFGKTDPGALARKGTAEEVAQLVCFLLGDESSFINGMVYGIDGGWMC